MKIRLPTCQLLAGAIVLIAFSGSAQLINGNFATGDFTGWTLFNTPNGGTSVSQVVPFDITGAGVPVNCAEFEVGETSGGIGGGGLGQGAGIYQDVTLGSGPLNISLDIAATSEGNNADGGTFELLLNGATVASDPLGGIGAGQTIRSTLNYSGSISAGTYQVAIEMLRGYGTEYPNTPYQYLSSIELSGSSVPEPSSLAICSAAFLVLLLFREAARFRRATNLNRVKTLKQETAE
ncbi:MAG TPA: hypothetical protein VGV18_12400 [Verrucomicrobiae bacterium]|nr:hypothetical protein [Verrucomicrobiae bacterium]